ncbi:hypothetical protein PFICI_04128 [Pestalotiopsis fici W106-1]|uniref:Uncharacterized protein n=1 Tax=Pestalotiopsis fici (strain W106-1 / CGMCC3.15140) TaxID=1229662 RepID=W3XJ61_PESFW|nr:uncharacterized protein PFICI_04128 [Pestalotiopsis fici W106-1]ETS86103.1 hypothetical protein PFICI_04128 [Pestalotiopsis fici W106-1]
MEASDTQSEGESQGDFPICSLANLQERLSATHPKLIQYKEDFKWVDAHQTHLQDDARDTFKNDQGILADISRSAEELSHLVSRHQLGPNELADVDHELKYIEDTMIYISEQIGSYKEEIDEYVQFTSTNGKKNWDHQLCWGCLKRHSEDNMVEIGCISGHWICIPTLRQCVIRFITMPNVGVPLCCMTFPMYEARYRSRYREALGFATFNLFLKAFERRYQPLGSTSLPSPSYEQDNEVQGNAEDAAEQARTRVATPVEAVVEETTKEAVAVEGTVVEQATSSLSLLAVSEYGASADDEQAERSFSS